MDMNATEIAAYLGASAWVPQILGWLYKLFTRPLITITPDKSVQIGYTTFGPIFNLRLSINADRKDALIDFMAIELRHEDGSAHNFEWAGMYELFSEVRSNKGESQTIHRDTTPITIKLSTLSPIINFFRFRETKFVESSNSVLDKLAEQLTYMQKADPDKFHEGFLQSKPVSDYLKFMRESFWWKAGNYTVTFNVRSPSKIKLISHSFQFHLSQDNIDSINNNVDEIKNALHYAINKPINPNLPSPTDPWIWLNPILKRVKNR